MSDAPPAEAVAAVGGALIRPGRDEDAEGLIRLIGDAWAEYPGCVLDVDGENPELRALASHFAARGGALWAAEDPASGEVVGVVGTRPLGSDEAWEVCRMYVRRDRRGTGLAHALLDAAEARSSREGGARRLVLWTDTRFEAAHAFYERRGYVRSGSIRILDDASRSLEFRYAKPARGLVVEALDAAAAASAERRLAAILVAAVAADGTGLGYRVPLAPDRARAHWRAVSSDVATGKRLVLAAWDEGRLAGTVALALDTPEDAPHRVEVATLLVDPAHRRRGVGRALIRRAEQAARGVGRRLLTAAARAGDAAEGLFRDLGWAEAGRVPGGVLDAGGAPRDAVLFWKAGA